MSDQARAILSDPRAPAAERFDAEAELAASHRPSLSDLMPRAELQPVIDYILDSGVGQDMMKAQGNIVQFPARGQPFAKRGKQSVHLDQFQIVAQGEYWDKPSGLGFDALRDLVIQTPILSAVVMTRVRQVARFCQPSEDGGPGFEIRHRDREHELTGEEKQTTQLLSRFFQHCGWEFNPRRRKRLRRDSFPQFMAKLVRDSLAMDAAPIETELKRNRELGIDGLYAVDGATIRLCSEEGYQGDDEVFALQVIDGRICTAYTHDDLVYEVRNPRSDVRLAGYGLSETEMLIRVVTGFLHAMTYNINGFDQNAIPKGLLTITGQYKPDELAAFKRMWNSMVRGVNNAWSLPVMVSEDQQGAAKFEKFGVEFNEMYFAKWMTFLSSIVCAVYGISPDEINFESFSSSRSSLSGSDTEEKITNSKDSGLIPLLTYFEGVLSDFVVAEFSGDLLFRWVGLSDEDPQQEWEARKLVLTVDELRAEKGYEPHPDKTIGQAPLNPSLVGPWMQLNMPQQPQGAQDFGDPDAEGGEGGPDPAGPEAQGQDASGEEPPEDAGQDAAAGFGGQDGGDYGGGDKEGDFGGGSLKKGFGFVWTIGRG